MKYSELISLAEDFVKYVPNNTTGKCWDVSIKFCSELFSKGLRNSIQGGTFNNFSHCWVDCYCEDVGIVVVDFTANQFGNYPKVIIGEKSEVFSKYPYNYTNVCI